MDNLLIYLIVVIAIGIGWWLGRSDRLRSKESAGAAKLPPSYYQGLNYLLNEQPDRAVSAFIQDLDVNEETLDTHLALGNLLRRRGEVEKALIVHENILAAENLAKETILNVQLELARDYLLAGLLDRAEGLLNQLVIQSGRIKQVALRMTLEIYEQMREWHKAIATAELLAGDAADDFEGNISHYYCELAEAAIASSQLEDAKTALSRAIGHNSKNARCSLLLGEVHLLEGNAAQAAQALQRIKDQDPGLVSESVELLLKAYEQLNQKDLKEYLQQCLAIQPSISIVLMLAVMLREETGDEEVARFISNHIKAHPTIRGLTQLIEYHIDNASGVAKENLAILRSFTEALVADKPSHRCKQCGFSGKKIHWHCPTCKTWGSVQPVVGLEGE